MLLNSYKNFLRAASAMAVFSVLAWAHNYRHELNGTWKLISTRSEFAGEPVIQTGTITIEDHGHDIFISRDFNFDGANETASYRSSLEGRENSSIYRGSGLQTEAKWEDRILLVTSTQDGVTTAVERYRLTGDGDMMLTVDRPAHQTESLLFERR